jgi:hypothetical protein
VGVLFLKFEEFGVGYFCGYVVFFHVVVVEG